MNNGNETMIEVVNARDVLRAVDGVAAVVAKSAPDNLADWADDTASRARMRAAGAGRLARMASRSVTASRTRTGGELTAGGSRRIPSGNGSYGDVFFGAEFGGGARPRTRQFRSYRRRGYWFFPTIEGRDDELTDAGEDTLDVAGDRWAG